MSYIPAPPDTKLRGVFTRVFRRSFHNELIAVFFISAMFLVALLAALSHELEDLRALTEIVNTSGRLRMLSQRTALLTLSASAGNTDAKNSLMNTQARFDEEMNSLRAMAWPHEHTVKQASITTPETIERVAQAWLALKDFSTASAQKGAGIPPSESAELVRLSSLALDAAEDNVRYFLPRADQLNLRIKMLLPIGIVGSILLVITAWLFIRVRLLRPLRALEGMLDELSHGNLSARLTLDRRDEIGRLIRHANRTANDLEASQLQKNNVLAQLRDSEIRHRTLWEIASEAIVTLDRHGLIRFANPSVERIFGYSPDELIGQNISVLQPAHLREAHLHGFARYLSSSERKMNWSSIEITALHRDGHELPVELSFSEMHLSDESWFVGTFRDITERKRQEEALLRSANFDALTGLPNRTLLFDRIDQAIHNSRRHNRSFGVLYLDLDNFKVINDSLGHDAGDQLLTEAAKRLLTCVRDGDTVARVGGDEFVLLLTELSCDDQIDTVAQRALTVMSTAFMIDESEGFVGASIGASIFPHDGATRAELVQHADIAMYRAKEYGRNNYQRYAEHMQARYKLRLSMESQLRRAVEADELVLHYQPQIDLASGRVIGAEALVRWESPSLGRVSPAQFIPLAEETGLIVPMGNWIFDRACRDAAHWRETPEGANCRVAINLSARQFGENNLLDSISAALYTHGLSASQIEVEITESMVMQNPDQANDVLKALRQLGCHVAIDDFGTGYSSLAYLRHFPLDVLKIDKSLISDVAIVRAVIQLARSFGLRTLAEGVEDEAVLRLLKHLGCDIIQGYYFSQPLPLAEFQRYLAANADGVTMESETSVNIP